MKRNFVNSIFLLQTVVVGSRVNSTLDENDRNSNSSSEMLHASSNIHEVRVLPETRVELTSRDQAILRNGKQLFEKYVLFLQHFLSRARFSSLHSVEDFKKKYQLLKFCKIIKCKLFYKHGS